VLAAVYRKARLVRSHEKFVRGSQLQNLRLSPHDRFRKANKWLASARHDLDRAEDVPPSGGLRNRAIGHVDEARRIVDNA
jgi:hypothetical protein